MMDGMKRPTNGDIEKIISSLADHELDEILEEPVVQELIQKHNNGKKVRC